jgi:far upstream element-binding protein
MPPAAPPAQQNNFPPPGAYGYPQPSSSGTVDLSAIKPVTSGTVSIQDAIAKAKAVAAANNLAPYERPPVYAGNDSRRRSRSRSPPRREAFHDNYNPYRDERRAERGGRDHGRERSYSPQRGRQGAFSPRGSNSARQRSPLRGEDDSSSETMQIEASLVGLIIGRQGENLRRVEGETKCRVQFLAPHSSDDKFRQCKITGPRARRAEAKAAINRIIDDSGMGAIARAGLDRGQPRPPPTVDPTSGQINLKDGEECLQIMVPDRTVGLIIGRGGETIRDLQERSGCHVNIVGESKSVNGLRPVNLIGPYAAAAQAKDLIMEIVDSDSRNGNPGGGGNQHQGRPNQRDNSHDKTNDAIFVPNEAVGMIIGKGGETIREMQNQTGCKINVSQQPAPGEAEREIELVGSRDAIERAKRAIEDKVEAVVSFLPCVW